MKNFSSALRVFVRAFQQGHVSPAVGDGRSVRRQHPGHGGVLPVDLALVVKGVASAVPALAQVHPQDVLPRNQQLRGDGTILDFGQNFAGFVEIDPAYMEGDTLKLRHGEILNADGSLYTTNLRKAKAEQNPTPAKFCPKSRMVTSPRLTADFTGTSSCTLV